MVMNSRYFKMLEKISGINSFVASYKKDGIYILNFYGIGLDKRRKYLLELDRINDFRKDRNRW
jgi:hypothetical protein